MRLRKNLRIWAMLLAMCFSVFAVVFVGGKVAPIFADLADKSENMTKSEMPIMEETTLSKVESTTVKSTQNMSLAQQLIEGYTADVDQEIFESSAIIGNSFAEDMKQYELVKTADFYTRNEMNVKTVADFVVEKTSVPIYDAISRKQYKNIIFMFGQNEMDWSEKTFESRFQQMVSSVTAGQQNAKLFICAVTPVSKDVSDRAVNGATVERVVALNGVLANLAAVNNAVFVDSTVLFANPEGYLADGASADGVHLEYKYSKALANLIAQKLEGKDKKISIQ